MPCYAGGVTGFGRAPARFQTTLWTIVRQAGSPHDPQRRYALGELIERYWEPVYVYLRRRGHDENAAQDLTQGFFTAVLEGRGLGTADPDRGRFRSYLLGALKHYVANDLRRDRAASRGGGWQRVPLDAAAAEANLDRDAVDDPEQAFRRRWARALLDRALARLEVDLSDAGRPLYHQVLMCTLEPDQPSYAQIAERLGITTNDVTNYLHRARKRLKALLQEEAYEQCGTVEEARDELAELFAR